MIYKNGVGSGFMRRRIRMPLIGLDDATATVYCNSHISPLDGGLYHFNKNLGLFMFCSLQLHIRWMILRLPEHNFIASS